MSDMPAESVDMIITSPPYNTGIEYDQHQDNMKWSDYLKFLNSVWSKCYDILKSGGRIAINIGNIGRTPFMPLSSHITQQLLQNNFRLRGYIYWDKGIEHSTAWGSWMSPSNPTLTADMEIIIIAHKTSPKIQHAGKSTIYQKKNF